MEFIYFQDKKKTDNPNFYSDEGLKGFVGYRQIDY